MQIDKYCLNSVMTYCFYSNNSFSTYALKYILLLRFISKRITQLKIIDAESESSSEDEETESDEGYADAEFTNSSSEEEEESEDE